MFALIFGTRLVPYAKSTINQIRERVKDSVSIDTQIGAARSQMSAVDREIKDMMLKVAQEEVGIRNLRSNLDQCQQQLDRQYSHVMKLKTHLDSGEEVYTSRGRTYSNDRVRDDLKSAFKVYKTSDRTVSEMQQTLTIREQGLDAAKKQLEEAINQRHELAVEIENLSARKQMVDVAKTASKLNLDNSELSEARQMVQEIGTRLDVEAQMMEMTPQYVGSIPCEDDEDAGQTDIVQQVNDYFQTQPSTGVAAK